MKFEKYQKIVKLRREQTSINKKVKEIKSELF